MFLQGPSTTMTQTMVLPDCVSVFLLSNQRFCTDVGRGEAQRGIPGEVNLFFRRKRGKTSNLDGSAHKGLADCRGVGSHKRPWHHRCFEASLAIESFGLF